ncbi:hypothetical protein BGW38_007510 [Lunasporangiospora selenospora]|uniref:SRR1-like domain-containing protein n=1 Tax=Lunasporangiospora selenospora TaxID=979761 RepID=A0A9P6G0I5_9FUNG|nr:hypothetical protein BGW38_007510 [Lunasporangiospora selenospora]
MIQQSTAAPSETDSEDSIAGGPNNTNDQLDNCNLPENFEPIEDIICYGIGSIESSRNSQFQLALGICLKEALQVKGTLSIFDPIMTDLDKELAEKLGCRVLEQNDQSYVGIKTRTLFYMPHCPKGLYSQILESNWTSECLSRIVIIGNRFTMYDESPLFRQIERQAPFILPALSIASVSPFPVEKFEDNTVFNDLAIHTFSPKTADLPAVSLEDREQDPEML